ncbi:MAG TPA: serine/threonine-protein kinase, partial [Allocoleopsis sp.]
MVTNTTKFGSGNPSESSNFNNSLIANRYQIKKLIGKGGMGRVYLAEDQLLGGVNVALKFLTQSVSGDAKILRNFSREARICAILGNQNIHIVRVIDYGIHLEEDPYYVMEYLPGQSLKAILDSRPIPLLEFLTIIKQFCIGLETAHNGIELDGKVYPVIHRDIKPANVYICPDPSLGWLVKILDFGIAKYFSDHSSMTQTNSYIGTLAYSSPEQIEGGDLDLRSDLYSLGVMMYEMLTNKLPWQINNASFGAWYKAHHYQEPDSLTDVSTEIEIPKSLIELVMSCLSKDRNNRPKDVAEIIANIALLQATMFPNFVPAQNQPKTLLQPENKTAEISPNEDDITPNNIPANNPPISPGKKPVIQGNITQVKTYFSQLTPAIEKACWASYWPKEKPISPIVFPNVILTENERLTGLWVMLAKSDIQKHIVSI